MKDKVLSVPAFLLALLLSLTDASARIGRGQETSRPEKLHRVVAGLKKHGTARFRQGMISVLEWDFVAHLLHLATDERGSLRER